MRALFLLVAALAFQQVRSAEIWWSVMHPTELDSDYMTQVVEKARQYGGVDGFEACGDCAGADNGLNGLLLFEPYAKTSAARDKASVAAQRERLRRCCTLAHSLGKPFIYWHRELYLPKTIRDDVPEMFDKDGNLDLLGAAYEKYLRWKIDAAYRAVPELDGLVLTLTEADYSVVHALDQKRYPADKVVAKIVRLFCEEHERRGKRFVLRSFGSIARDYEDLLAGAAPVAKEHRFEIETKVTPYDFSPFLPDNPFLRHLPGTTLAAECDCLGEYLGAGYLPAAQVGAVRRYVQQGLARNVERFTIRIDRVGNRIFDSAQEVNLLAYMRFIRRPELTEREVVSEYAARRWPKCPDEMAALADMGFELVRKTQFVCDHVAFHQNPVTPNFKYLKACGIFSVFRDGENLLNAHDQWGILSDRRAPGRAAIRAEKDEAVRLADEGLRRLEALKDRLDPEEYARQHRAWSIAPKAARTIRAFAYCAAAYFDDMAADRDDPTALKAAVAEAEKTIVPMMRNPNFTLEGYDFTHARATGEDLDRVYFVPFLWLCREFPNEYRAERAMRKAFQQRTDVLDFVIPGGIYDDNRVDRIMHASYQEIRPDGNLVRFVGNRVFPNGTIAVDFPNVGGGRVAVDLDPAFAQDCVLTDVTTNDTRRVTIGAKGSVPPAVRSIALVVDPTDRPWLSAQERLATRRIGSLIDFQPGDPETDAKRIYSKPDKSAWVDVNYDEAKSGEGTYTLEDPLAFADGRKLKDASEWPVRRREILSLFEREVYGRLPPKPEAMPIELLSEELTEDRFAFKRTYRQWYRADRTGPHVDWLVIVPRHTKGKCPVFLMLNYGGNDKIYAGRTNHYVMPWQMLVAEGYAYMTAKYTDFAGDGGSRDLVFNGVFELWGTRDPKRTDNTGSLMAWAWGLMRGLDLAGTVSEIDATRNVVIGSSRLGKAALLAGAYDERFKVVVPNQTGGGGVQLLKRDYGESPRAQKLLLPHWYCSGYWKWADDPRKQPFDQHLLLACVAPRNLLLECYHKKWFDPKGEFMAARAASPVWEFLTGKGLPCATWPDPYDDVAVRPPFGYVRRTECHGLAPHDWKWAIDFANRAFRRCIGPVADDAGMEIDGFYRCTAAKPQMMLEKDGTVFTCGFKDGRFRFRFDVKDADVCVAETVKHPLDLANGDRVEVYFVPDAEMKKGYRCAEIDASGRVLSYSVDEKKKFDWFWKFATLESRAAKTADGYVVEGSVAVEELVSFGVDPKAFHLGVFRAEMSAPGKTAAWCSAAPLVLPAHFHQPVMLFPYAANGRSSR